MLNEVPDLQGPLVGVRENHPDKPWDAALGCVCGGWACPASATKPTASTSRTSARLSSRTGHPSANAGKPGGPSARRPELAGEPAHGIGLHGIHGEGDLLRPRARGALEGPLIETSLSRRDPCQGHPMFAHRTHRTIVRRTHTPSPSGGGLVYPGSAAGFNHGRNAGVPDELVRRAARKCGPAWPRPQPPIVPKGGAAPISSGSLVRARPVRIENPWDGCGKY
jgi:hypothetical protein